MFLADCGVIPDPSVEQLADIAVSTAQLSRQVLNVRPRVALLSYSTKGSATHPSIGKVQAATALARQKAQQKLLEADFDGELQVDAALIPESLVTEHIGVRLSVIRRSGGRGLRSRLRPVIKPSSHGSIPSRLTRSRAVPCWI